MENKLSHRNYPNNVSKDNLLLIPRLSPMVFLIVPRNQFMGYQMQQSGGPNAHQTLLNLNKDYGTCKTRSDGISIVGHLGGYTSSSSRVELLGAILALFSDLPLHLAIDNASDVRRAKRYIDWLQHAPESPPPGAPLGHTTNGDLWKIFCVTLRARGPHTVKVKKIRAMLLRIAKFWKNIRH